MPLFRYCGVAVLSVVLFAQTGPVAQAWIAAEAPSRLYYNTTLPSFYLGNFADTLNFLNRDLRNAVRINHGNQQVFLWLDSLCYWTLQGECHFQTARYDEALRSFTTALQIYFEQANWLTSISVS